MRLVRDAFAALSATSMLSSVLEQRATPPNPPLPAGEGQRQRQRITHAGVCWSCLLCSSPAGRGRLGGGTASDLPAKCLAPVGDASSTCLKHRPANITREKHRVQGALPLDWAVESAGQSRRTQVHRGKSGLHRAECQVTPGQRELTASATESRPPNGIFGCAW